MIEQGSPRDFTQGMTYVTAPWGIQKVHLQRQNPFTGFPLPVNSAVAVRFHVFRDRLIRLLSVDSVVLSSLDA